MARARRPDIPSAVRDPSSPPGGLGLTRSSTLLFVERESLAAARTTIMIGPGHHHRAPTHTDDQQSRARHVGREHANRRLHRAFHDAGAGKGTSNGPRPTRPLGAGPPLGIVTLTRRRSGTSSSARVRPNAVAWFTTQAATAGGAVTSCQTRSGRPSPAGTRVPTAGAGVAESAARSRRTRRGTVAPARPI